MKCISRDERTPCKCTELLKSEWVGDTEVTLDCTELLKSERHVLAIFSIDRYCPLCTAYYPLV